MLDAINFNEAVLTERLNNMYCLIEIMCQLICLQLNWKIHAPTKYANLHFSSEKLSRLLQ